MPAENIDNLNDDEFADLIARPATGTATNQEIEDAKDSAAQARDARGK